MNIYLDNIIFYLQNIGGISVYWYQLIEKIIRSKYNVIFIERSRSKKCNNLLRNLLDIDEKKIEAEIKIPVKIIRYLPLQRKIKERSIFHSSYYRIANQPNILNIVTVHDFIYEKYMHGLPRFIHSLQKAYALKNASGIICVSNNTKSDLLEYYPNVNEDNIEVIYNGVGKEFYPIEKNKILNSDLYWLLTKKYILYVGDRKKYKNFQIAFEVVSELKDYNLVIVGGKELSVKEKKSLDKRLSERYYHVVNVSSSDLNLLYNYAFCLLYPSSYEGFGIPILEAMKSGCPVVAAYNSSISEIVNSAEILVSDMKKEEYIKKIKALEIKEYRENIIESGFKQASKFSWDKCYNDTINFYNKIYEKYTYK